MYEIGAERNAVTSRSGASRQTKALALLKAHTAPAGRRSRRATTPHLDVRRQKAEFRWYTTAGNQRRATSAAIFSQQLGAIGIKIERRLRAGQPELLRDASCRTHDFDLAEYAWSSAVPIRRASTRSIVQARGWRPELQAVLQQEGRRADRPGRRRAQPDEADRARTSRRRRIIATDLPIDPAVRPAARSSSTSRRSRAWSTATTRPASARRGTSRSGTGRPEDLGRIQYELTRKDPRPPVERRARIRPSLRPDATSDTVLTYIVRRVLYSIPVLLVSSFLSFTFVSLAGDPIGEPARRTRRSRSTRCTSIAAQYHLDRSIPVRYGYWLQDVFTHKLGNSLLDLAADLARHHADDRAHGAGDHARGGRSRSSSGSPSASSRRSASTRSSTTRSRR